MKFPAKLTAIFLALILFLQINIASATVSDVVVDHPAFEAVQAFEKAEALPDLKNNKLLPNKKVTREEFIKMILKFSGRDFTKKYRGRTRFKDVPSNSPFAAYIYTALDAGAVNLPADKLFHPNRLITLVEALKITFHLEGIPVKRFLSKPLNYQDLKKYSEEEALANEALQLNLINPKNTKKFGAQDRMSRLESIDLIYKINLLADTAQKLLRQELPEDLTKYIEVTLSPISGNQQMDILTSVLDYIKQKYLHADEVNEEKLLRDATAGLVKSLNDPYSIYFQPVESNSFREDLGGEIEGIGAYVEIKDGQVIIVTPLQDSPSEKAGVKAGDIILKVNGVDLAGMNISDAVNQIKGARGTIALLTIKRNGSTLEIAVTRDKVVIHSVSLQMRDRTAIVTINQFGEKTTQEFRDIIEKLKTQNAENIVLDLRNNPGGLLNVAMDILSFFVEGEHIGTIIKYRGQKTEEQTIYGTGELKKYPLSVLVNKGSASASEILAGALQDYKVTKVIGQQSFGKGTVQELIQFPDSSSLKLTIAKWLTPLGREINGIGVTPDIKIEITADDERTGFDAILERGIQEVRK